MRPSRTAQYVALYRALESEEPRREPLFRDPLAKSFLPSGLRVAVRLARVAWLRPWLERYADYRAPGARSSAICRTRFIDDVVRAEAIAGSGQLVILGAGFDCRAHRIAELAGARVFEVDRQQTQARKRAVLARSPALASNRSVVYVQVDFERDDLRARLQTAGWDGDARTTFVWEGVSNYLDAHAVADVLELVGHAAEGSAIVLTYLHRGVLDGSTRFEGADKVRANVARMGEPWKFGLDPAETGSFVARFGLRLEQDFGADEYRAHCAWHASKGYEFYRIAVARVEAIPTRA